MIKGQPNLEKTYTKPKTMTTIYSQIQLRNKAQLLQQLIFHRKESGSATLPVFRSNPNMLPDKKNPVTSRRVNTEHTGIENTYAVCFL